MKPSPKWRDGFGLKNATENKRLFEYVARSRVMPKEGSLVLYKLCSTSFSHLYSWIFQERPDALVKWAGRSISLTEMGLSQTQLKTSGFCWYTSNMFAYSRLSFNLHWLVLPLSDNLTPSSKNKKRTRPEPLWNCLLKCFCFGKKKKTVF